jgi:hypothetical protein
MIHLKSTVAAQTLLIGIQINNLPRLGAGHPDKRIIHNRLWIPGKRPSRKKKNGYTK